MTVKFTKLQLMSFMYLINETITKGNLCFHHHLPTSGGCFKFRPSVLMMR